MEQRENVRARILQHVAVDCLAVCLLLLVRGVPSVISYGTTLLCLMDCYFKHRDFIYLFASSRFAICGLIWTHNYNFLVTNMFLCNYIHWGHLSFFNEYYFPTSLIENYICLVLIKWYGNVFVGKMYTLILLSFTMTRYFYDFRKRSWADLLLIVCMWFVWTVTVEERTPVWCLGTAYGIFLFWAYCHSRTFRNSNSARQVQE